MTEIDLPTALTLIVGLVFGGSGLVAWFLTYVQIKDARTEHARSYFRTTVLTPEFLGFLGALFDIGAFIAAADLKARKKELAEQLTRLRDIAKKTSSVFFFVPTELQTQVAVLLKIANELSEALAKGNFAAISSSKIGDQSYELSRQLKSVLGIKEFDREGIQFHTAGESLTEDIIGNIFGGAIGAIIAIYYATMIPVPSNGDYSIKLIVSLIIVIIPFSLIKWWFSFSRKRK